MTLGFMVSPLLQSRLDSKYINIIFLGSMSASMLGLGLSFLYPSLGSYLSIPCLVGAGASYGLGVGPVPYILMSSLFTQNNKSVGVAISQTSRALTAFTQIKVDIYTLQIFCVSTYLQTTQNLPRPSP